MAERLPLYLHFFVTIHHEEHEGHEDVTEQVSLCLLSIFPH
ncbi:MAG: hypothetical protein AB1422_13065 [bacterium]